MLEKCEMWNDVWCDVLCDLKKKGLTEMDYLTEWIIVSSHNLTPQQLKE